MRIAICLLALMAYLISFNLYIFNITNPDLLPEQKKLWYCYTTGLILVFYTIDGWNGYKSLLHDAIAKFTMIVVIVNFVVIALTHHGFVSNPACLFIVYNTIWMLIVGMVLVSSWRNGLLKK